ncbi:hypothetical protein [Sorangium sp. So ce1099]|uniref:hypothetical protein n=1 Tax=Sorangium sp. So ce1099 TaxID=3133331 RepID=UPI003F641D5B
MAIPVQAAREALAVLEGVSPELAGLAAVVVSPVLAAMVAKTLVQAAPGPRAAARPTEPRRAPPPALAAMAARDDDRIQQRCKDWRLGDGYRIQQRCKRWR